MFKLLIDGDESVCVAFFFSFVLVGVGMCFNIFMKEFKYVFGCEYKVVIVFCLMFFCIFILIFICFCKLILLLINMVNSSRVIDSFTRFFGRTTTVFVCERSVVKVFFDIL